MKEKQKMMQSRESEKERRERQTGPKASVQGKIVCQVMLNLNEGRSSKVPGYRGKVRSARQLKHSGGEGGKERHTTSNN